jgi:hypothetical protein
MGLVTPLVTTKEKVATSKRKRKRKGKDTRTLHRNINPELDWSAAISLR